MQGNQQESAMGNLSTHCNIVKVSPLVYHIFHLLAGYLSLAVAFSFQCYKLTVYAISFGFRLFLKAYRKRNVS